MCRQSGIGYAPTGYRETSFPSSCKPSHPNKENYHRNVERPFPFRHIIPRDSYARPTVWGMKSPAGGGRGVGCFNIEVTVRSFGDSYIESKQYADRVREYTLHILRVFSRLLSTDKLRNMYLYHRSVRSLCTFR